MREKIEKLKGEAKPLEGDEVVEDGNDSGSDWGWDLGYEVGDNYEGDCIG